LRGKRDITTRHLFQLNASYELDLWGKLARQSDAAHWEVQATEQDRRSAALSLVGTTATLYWQMGYINQRLQSSLESIAYARKTAELVNTQYQAGAVSALEEAEARQSLTSQQAAHTLLVQQRVEYVNALAILFDGPPGALVADSKHLPQTRLSVPRAGVPAELLVRRPDL
jgi:outer membrane protein TolC